MEGIMEHYIDGKTIALFTEKLTELERSSLTVAKYVRDVSTFRRWLGSDGQVDKNRVIRFKQMLRDIRFKQMLRDKYRLSSANSMLSALNKFFQLMGWEDCRIRTFRTQRASFRNEERELSVEEYRRLLHAAKEKGDLQILSIMETIASTGIRISELQFITVASVSTRRALVSLKGKTRQVLIPAELCKKLRRYCRERKINSGSIFVTRTGKPQGENLPPQPEALLRGQLLQDGERYCPSRRSAGTCQHQHDPDLHTDQLRESTGYTGQS